MTIKFNNPENSSLFKVGDRVKIDLTPFFKKAPYEFIEGTIYLVRVEFPLLWSNQRNFVGQINELKFRYGVQPDTTKFPQMKDADDKLYDIAEEYLDVV
jgi:hypothetical protein